MRHRLFGLLAVAALVASACQGASSPSPAASPSAASPAASPSAAASTSPSPSAAQVPDLTTTTYKAEPVGNTGGKLILSEWQEPATAWWNIYDNAATDVEAFGMSLWSLWSVTPDFKYYGQLATNVPTVPNGGVTVNGDKMDVKIDLVDGAMWSDGQPINCDDLIYQWHWQMDKGQVGNIQGTPGWEDIGSIDGTGTTHCVVHFNKIYEPYLTLFSPVLPAHYLKTASVADAVNKLYTNSHPEKGVYSGPYIPTKWAAGAEIDFAPNAQFWTTIKKTKAPFDQVIFKYYGDPQSESAGFINNESDVAMNFNHSDLPKLSGVDPKSIDSTQGLTYEQNSWNYTSLTKKFGDAGAKALMSALHYAYDKDAIISRVLGGTVKPSCNFVAPEAWFYSEIPCYTHDQAKAQSILDAAGFKKGSDGALVAPNGTKVDLLGCTSASRQYRIDSLTLLASQLQPYGIKLTVSPVNSSKVLFAGWTQVAADTPCNTTHGNFDVAEFAWVATPDPGSIYFLYRSTLDPSLGDHSGQNYIRIKNPDLDTLLEKMLRSVDLLSVKDTMAKIQDLYVNPDNAFPEIALYNWKTVILKNLKMHNVVNNSTAATNTWNVEDWWREP